MECVAVSEVLLDERVQPEQKSCQSLVSELWHMAQKYVRDSGLVNAVLKCEKGSIVMTNAPYAGTVPICAIEDGQLVPYF